MYLCHKVICDKVVMKEEGRYYFLSPLQLIHLGIFMKQDKELVTFVFTEEIFSA